MIAQGWRTCARAGNAALIALALAGPADGQMELTVDPITIDVQTTLSAVTVYRDRASITRQATLQLEPGAYELIASGLPESIQQETLQARAVGPMRILAVEYEQRDVASYESPVVIELDDQISAARRHAAEIEGRRELVEARRAFISAVSVRATSEASQVGGTDALDLEAVRRQLDFITEQLADVVEQRRQLDDEATRVEREIQVLQTQRSAVAGTATTRRSAVVSAFVSAASEVTLELGYLVGETGWLPTYNVRADRERASVVLEYDAQIVQRTGEDWLNVRLTLSTAQPLVAANPPSLLPWYVDIFDPVLASGGQGEGPQAERLPDLPRELGGAGVDADLAGPPPTVTYNLARPATITTDALKSQRTRIAAFDTDPQFVHVGVANLTDAVYIRGTLTNRSAYQLLPGPVSIFVGQDYVGPTRLPTVPPQGRILVYFGIDQAVTVARQLVSKRTTKTGLLAGGRQTDYVYRIMVDNGTGRPIDLELWDRYPMSRSERIRIDLVDVSTPLASDEEYVSSGGPAGLLKWLLRGLSPTTSSPPLEITYGVRVNRDKDVVMTPLPE